MKEKSILMKILQMSLEKRLEMLSERQKTYVQGYLDGILQACKPLKLNGDTPRQNREHEKK
ncbi:MAG: hypothetical protein LBQ57_05950 [Spirochaetales bacterium]|jgi:hypothetical protein|nr:hypothetical protein [Spirochaetales bacterium]